MQGRKRNARVWRVWSFDCLSRECECGLVDEFVLGMDERCQVEESSDGNRRMG